MPVGMMRVASTLCEMCQESGDTLLMPLCPDSITWRLKVGSKCTKQAGIWGWQDQDILAFRNGWKPLVTLRNREKLRYTI